MALYLKVHIKLKVHLIFLPPEENFRLFLTLRKSCIFGLSGVCAPAQRSGSRHYLSSLFLSELFAFSPEGVVIGF